MRTFPRVLRALLTVAGSLFCLASAFAQTSGASGRQPVYRLFRAMDMDHLYTVNAAEVAADEQNGYVLEGVVGFAPPASAANATPLYRLYFPWTADHFYTADPSEAIAAMTYGGYQYEGVAFPVLPTSGAGTEPLYRFWWPSGRKHFYTANPAERALVLAAGFDDEGGAGYLFSNDLTPPAAPTGLTAAGQWVTNCPTCKMAMAHVVLAWNAVAGADGYRVFRDGALLQDDVTAVGYTDMAVTSGQTYAYTICAVCGGVAGAQSGPVSATAPNPPASAMPGFTAPANLRVQGAWQGGPTDLLAWDPVPGAATYNVYQYDQLIAKGVTGTSFSVPAAQFNGAMTYTVTAVDGDCACESLPSAMTMAQGAVDPTQAPGWTPSAPVTPTNVVATPDWNAGAPRISLAWDGISTDYTYNVYRDGVKIASGLWRLAYIDGAVKPGETHTYAVTGVNVPWTKSAESAPSGAVTATALTAAPSLQTAKVQITQIVPDDDSVLVCFAPVPGAVDYRVYVSGKPSAVKYSGGGLSIQMNGLDPTQPTSLVVEALDKLGPFQKMDGGMGPGAMQMDGTTDTATNGQGDPSNVPNVIAASDPFSVTFQPFALAGGQAFYDTFRGSQPFVASTDMDPAVAALSSPFFEVNEVENDKWRVRTYGVDSAMTKVFVMGNHFMDTLYDGPTAATQSFSHNNNASLVMMPKATADISGGKVLHVTFEVDGHLDSRRWIDVFVGGAGDPLLVPGKFAENNELPTAKGNLFRWEIESKVHDAQIFLGADAGGNLRQMELFDVANGVGADDFGPAARTSWDGKPLLNGTAQDLDKRHRFDLYLSQTRFRVTETVPGADPVVVKDETFPNGLALPFDKCQVYYVHQLYHTGNDRPELVNYSPSESYWYNDRPWADERHWDDMGQEVLPSFPQ